VPATIHEAAHRCAVPFSNFYYGYSDIRLFTELPSRLVRIASQLLDLATSPKKPKYTVVGRYHQLSSSFDDDTCDP
jgi:hypothetical protein